MQTWRRAFWKALALPVLVILDIEPGRGADRRLAAAFWIVRALIFLAFIAGLFWLVEPFLALADRVEVFLALVVFGILGTLFELVALDGFLQVAVLLWRGRRTTATVVPGADPSEEPRFQFSDPGGQTHVVRGPVSSVHREYGAGQQVPLVYLPGRPEKFVVDRFGDKWGVPLFFFVLGLLILLPWSVFAFGLKRYITTRIAVFGPLMFLAVGGIFASLGFTFAVKALRFRRRALWATGVIVAAKSQRELWAERAQGGPEGLDEAASA